MNKLAALLKNNIARVIYVILADKYVTTYLTQLLPSNGGSLGFNIFSRSGYQWHLTTNERYLAAPPPQND